MDQEEVKLAAARAELLSGILQYVGYALWQCAECEDALAHSVVIRMRNTRGVGVEAATPIIDKVQSRTFGQLLKELEREGVLPAALNGRLQQLVKERNWLVHHAKREYRGVLNDLQRVEALITRLDRIAEDATQLQSELGADLEEYVVTSGVGRDVIDREAMRLIEEWGYAE